MTAQLGTESYLSFCAGKGKERGNCPMSTENIALCYNVQRSRVTGLVHEAAYWLASHPSRLHAAQSGCGSEPWISVQSSLISWLRDESSWSSNHLFGRNNVTVPDDCREEAVLRVVTDARASLSACLSYHINLLFRKHPTKSLLDSGSPTPSQLGGAHSDIGTLHNPRSSFATLRIVNIHFVDGQANVVKKLPLRKVCVEVSNIEGDISPSHAIYSKIEDALRETGRDPAKILMRHNGENIRNQHELEAALNDFRNGLRKAESFDINLRLRGEIRISGAKSGQLRARQAPSTTSQALQIPMPKSKFSSPPSALEANQNHDRVGYTSEDNASGRLKLNDGCPAYTKPIKASNREVLPPKAGQLRAPGVEYEEEPHIDPTLVNKDDGSTINVDDDDDYDDEHDEYDGTELNDDNLEERLLAATAETLRRSDAGSKAAHATRDEWQRAADTFGVSLMRMAEQFKSKDRYISISPGLGLNPKFGLMAHQIVGSDCLHDLVFGPKRGAVLADQMGMGKTIQILTTWYMNWFLVMRQQNQKLPCKDRLAIDSKGMFKGRSPRVGATFLCAAATGVEPWPRDWKKLMENSWAMNKNRTCYKPKMIILHDSGKQLCEKYGGADMGLYHKLTERDLIEIYPEPDWEKARIAMSEWKHHFDEVKSDSQVDFGDSAPSRKAHPDATKLQPSPTSSRFIILSTWHAWNTRVYDILNKNTKAVINIHNEYTDADLAKVTKLRERDQRVRKQLQIQMANDKDGRQPNQVTREALWTDPKGKKKRIEMVADLFYAAWVIVDEIHSAGSKGTRTYRLIIEPFNRHPDRSLRPSFTAITGSMLANGISTTLTFAAKALRRKDPKWAEIQDTAVKQLRNLNISKVKKAWDVIQASVKAKQKTSMSELIKSNQEVKELFETFGHIYASFFIRREYSSRDPWNRPLKIMSGKLNKQYLTLRYNDSYHKALIEVERDLSSRITEKYQEDMARWKIDIKRGKKKPKPKKIKASNLDHHAFAKARLLASFPNFFNALQMHREEDENCDLLINNSEWEDSISGDNDALQDILGSPSKILNSVLYRYIDEICMGSAKMQHIVYQIECLRKEKSQAKHPTREDLMCEFISKYCIATNVRLCKAILYAKLVKTFGSNHIAYIGEGSDTRAEVDNWRKYADHDGKRDDGVFIMVAGLKSICQSMDLVEGHVFEGLEPHPINAEAVQYCYRGYRPGQEAPVVYVNWLVHSGSFVETTIYAKNKARDNFAEQVGKADLSGSKEVPLELE